MFRGRIVCRFASFKGLSNGVYTLMPGVRGYQLADGDTGEVFMDRDGKRCCAGRGAATGKAVKVFLEGG